MALVLTNNRRFTVEFEALTAKGKPGYFQSIYTPSGKPIAVRRPDRRSLYERYRRGFKQRKRTTEQQGIYRDYSLGGYLVFIDKLVSERELFLNWRSGKAVSYRRIPIGEVLFLPYGARPSPIVSEVIFVNEHLFVAWMTRSQPYDLILSSVNPRSGVRRDRVIAPQLNYFTMLSLAHIGTHGLIVAARAMIGDDDAKINVYPVNVRIVTRHRARVSKRACP
jgi:hypothetical protein